MLFADIFDAEIIDDESKRDGASVMEPEGRGSGSWSVAILGEMNGKSVIRDTAGLF